MGYRNYLGSITKKEHNKIKKFTRAQLYEYKNEPYDENDPYDTGYVGVYDVCTDSKYLYELGKYVDQFDKKFFKPVFLNKDLQKWYEEEHDFYIVGKEFVEEVIKNYTEKVRTYYREMFAPFCNDIGKGFSLPDYDKVTKEDLQKMYIIIDHARSMACEWGVTSFIGDMNPLDMDPENEKITTSWKYEYELFELVRIYKTFDWKNKIMIYYGY
jgi:hypothetical protein